MYKGYKVMHETPDPRIAKSIFNGDEIVLNIGRWWFNPKGIYLGTSEQFCKDYYSSAGEEGAEPELMLTVGYTKRSILKGDPDYKNGEVIVNSAKLLAVRKLKG